MSANRWHALKPYNRDMISMSIGGVTGAVIAILISYSVASLWPRETVSVTEFLAWMLLGSAFTSGGMALALIVSHRFEDRHH